MILDMLLIVWTLLSANLLWLCPASDSFPDHSAITGFALGALAKLNQQLRAVCPNDLCLGQPEQCTGLLRPANKCDKETGTKV